MQLDLFWCSQSKCLSWFRLGSVCSLAPFPLLTSSLHIWPSLFARRVWRQHNFLTLPNFALLVLVWKELGKCPSAHWSSSFQLKIKVLFWYAWCSHHISPYSVSFLLLSSPTAWKYTLVQEQSALFSSHAPQETLLWQHSETRVNSNRELSLSDCAAASGLLLSFWSRSALLTDLCCLVKVLGTRTRPLCFGQSVSVL